MTKTSTVVAKGYLEDCVSIDTRCRTGLGPLLSFLLGFRCQRGVTLAGASLADQQSRGPYTALTRVSNAKNPDLTSFSCVFCTVTTAVLQSNQEHLEAQDVCPSPNF